MTTPSKIALSNGVLKYMNKPTQRELDFFDAGYRQALEDVNDELQKFFNGEQLIDSADASLILQGLKK